MRVLTKLEKLEFEKTYDFLNHYIGSASTRAKKIEQIRFDGKLANAEILRFVNKFKNIFKIDGINLNLINKNELEKINLLFNDSDNEKKQIVMNRLVSYCFNNKIQPSRLRMINYENYSIERDIEPIVYEFQGDNSETKNDEITQSNKLNSMLEDSFNYSRVS